MIYKNELLFQYFKFQLGDAKVFFYVRGQNLPFTETTLQAYENIWNFADDLSWKYYQNSHILQMDLPRSLPCIRNLVVLSQCPEVIACIIIQGLFCTLQWAFSPQEPCRHSSFTPTGGSGGGGVISVSVEYFQSNFDNVGWVNENGYSILCFKKQEKSMDHVIKGWIFLANT